MWEQRALKLVITRSLTGTGSDRVGVFIYADDDCSPVVQAFAIPLERVKIELKQHYDDPFPIKTWRFADLITEVKSE